MWYGISSTGGQTGEAIIKLIGMARKEDSSAVETLEKDRFVDDLLGGNKTKEGVNLQVNGTTSILGRGGFSLKSLESNPCKKASSNGETVKMLRYKWTTEPDVLSPGLGDLNFNKNI